MPSHLGEIVRPTGNVSALSDLIPMLLNHTNLLASESYAEEARKLEKAQDI